MTVRRLRRHAGNQAAGWAQSAILISKMVLSTVNLGPPNWTKSRAFTLRFRLAAWAQGCRMRLSRPPNLSDRALTTPS